MQMLYAPQIVEWACTLGVQFRTLRSGAGIVGAEEKKFKSFMQIHAAALSTPYNAVTKST
jgi:hypothetical protein